MLSKYRTLSLLAEGMQKQTQGLSLMFKEQHLRLCTIQLANVRYTAAISLTAWYLK